MFLEEVRQKGYGGIRAERDRNRQDLNSGVVCGVTLPKDIDGVLNHDKLHVFEEVRQKGYGGIRPKRDQNGRDLKSSVVTALLYPKISTVF